MADFGGSDFIKSIVLLSSILILESSMILINWNREIRDYLMIARFGDLLTCQSTSLLQGDLTIEA